MKKQFYIISHTHWDREWYQPYEKFRIKLCDLINNLIEIIKEYPSYIFHLDAQTIVLEDYEEIFPENAEILKRYIKNGNIIVGPWYVQNDFFLSSGEATIRNILIGTEIAEKHGACANVGYTPDQFGLCSQLPQIFENFGIKYHLFARGCTFVKSGTTNDRLPAPCNFYWEAPDGSRVFSTYMPFWYNNAQRFTPDIELAVKRIYKEEKRFKELTESPYILLMNGVDHLEPQDDLFPVVKRINEQLDGIELVQTSMDKALPAMEKYASEKIVKGELRYGSEDMILTGTLSVRTEIKRKNFEIQNMIEHCIEPLYTMILMCGANIYPQNFIKYMWKMLIPNHAHDSICCCSTPNVMKHMADRFMRICEVGEELLMRGCKFINNHIERNSNEKGVYYLTVINTFQHDYTGVIDVEIDINASDVSGAFAIYAPSGEEVMFETVSKETACHATMSPLNLPGNVNVIRYKVKLYAENIPSFGYVNYTVRTGTKPQMAKKGTFLENEFIKIEIADNQINMIDKRNVRVFSNILEFEDVGDKGDAYVFSALEEDAPIKATLEKQECIMKNSLVSKVKLYYSVTAPCGHDGVRRCGGFVKNRTEVTLTVRKGVPAVEIDVKTENNIKYHLFRAVVNTGIKNKISYSSSVFDVIERNSKDVNPENRNYTQPNNGYIYKKDAKGGVAVFTKGLYEYDNEIDEKLRLSLIRSIDEIFKGDFDSRIWGVEDNLMLGTYEQSFAIMPFTGNGEEVAAMEQNINSQPLYYFDNIDVKMFSGGRPAVQDTEIDEIYYPEDKYADISLPHKRQLLSVSNKVVVSALKKEEKGDGAVLRVFNPTTSMVNNVLLTACDCKKTDMSEKSDEGFDNTAPAKKIITLKLLTGKKC